MPRRRAKPEKETVTVVFDGTPIAVVLHPPTGTRASWYAYWSGAVTSKSTGHADRDQALAAAENMVREWKAGGTGQRTRADDLVMSDEEFIEIQRRHYARKKDPKAQKRAGLTLAGCLQAIAAFRDVIREDPIKFTRPVAAATPDICAKFMENAQARPRNWRKQYENSKPDQRPLTPNTVIKWLRELQAAFERANTNAGKKCVRGVVDEAKLLTDNPWKKFTWIEGTARPIRQFDPDELTGFLDYLAKGWPDVTIAAALAKVFFWSQSRRLEGASLRWDGRRLVHGECHFRIEGKWGVVKWVRIPERLHQELLGLAADESPYVFAAYTPQLRAHYAAKGRPDRVGEEFDPVNLADWFHNRVTAWAATLPKGHATTHIFRKTALQYARSGADRDGLNRQVARDARVSEDVLMTHYVEEGAEEMRAASNRTFARIVAALPPAVASRYGYDPPAPADPLETEMQAAWATKDWRLVGRLSAKLAAQGKRVPG
jgi:hypothetical protein